MKPQTAFLTLIAASLAGSFGPWALAQQQTASPPPAPVMQPTQHRCELSADKRMVSLSVTNPSSQLSECTVTCYLPYKGGTATVTCTKFVDANAVNAPLCAHGREKDGVYTKLERSTGQCSVTPVELPPSVAKAKRDEGLVMRHKPSWDEMTQEERLQDFTRGMGRKF